MKKNSDIDDKQYAAIQKRLDSGRTLTAAQMRFVTNYLSEDISETPSGVASGVSDLARRLNVNRQVIHWHAGRAEAPKTLSVAEWREYLLVHGKGSTIDRMTEGPSGNDAADVKPDELCLAQFHAVSNALPNAVRFALEGVELSSAAIDMVTLRVWLVIATAQQAFAERQGFTGILDPYEGDNVDYPSAIVAICNFEDKTPEPK